MLKKGKGLANRPPSFMKVHLKVFPIPSVCPEKTDLFLELTDSPTVAELLLMTESKLGTTIPADGEIMLIHNGAAVDMADCFREIGKGDWLWLLPAVGRS
jgi:hypothetical protein